MVKLCDPVVVRNGTGEGAALSLDAIGKQDTFLLDKDPEKSLFYYNNVEHTKFIKKFNYYTLENPNFKTLGIPLQTRFTQLGGTSNVISDVVENCSHMDALTWPFNSRVEFTINPKNSGDLLGNMYLKFTISGEKNPSPWYDFKNKGNQYFTPNAARSMIDNIELMVNGTLVEKLDGKWLHMFDDIYANREKTIMRETLMNGGLPGDMFNRVWVDRTTGFDFYMPMDLFFCHTKLEKKTRYLPLAALYNQTITIRVQFNNSQYFCANKFFPYTPKLTLVTEEYMVTPQEREYILEHDYSIPINIIAPHPLVNTDGKTNIQSEIVANNAIKGLHWIFTRKDFIDLDDSDWFGWLNRPNTQFDYAPYNSMQFYQERLTDNENNDPSMFNATFFINTTEYDNFIVNSKEAQDSPYPPFYYKYIQNYQHNLAPPYRNVYTLSFTENMKTQTPEGIINIQKVPQGNAFMKIDMKETATRNYVMFMYYTGFKNLEIKRGMTQVY